MARIVSTENPNADVRRFLRRWAAVPFVEQRLLEQHSGTTTERRRKLARQVAGLIQQGLAFLGSADNSATITKPLTLFYATENLAKAAILVRTPTLDADDIRFHGLSGERDRKRNSIKNLSCSVQKPGRDFWSHAFAVLNSDRFRYPLVNDGKGEEAGVRFGYLTPPLRQGDNLQFGELVKHLPDIGDDVELAGWGPSFMVRIEGLSIRYFSAPDRAGRISFDLCHEHRPDVKNLLNAAENGRLRGLERIADNLNVYEYERPIPAEAPEASLKIGEVVRCNVFGDLYMDVSSTKRILGELPLYIAALFILSDVVRYQAEHWLRLLSDHAVEEVVVERFLDIAARKVPNLTLNELHNETHEFKLARG